MIYFKKDFINFFKELETNNTKDWFDNNRKRYFESVKKPAEKFVDDLIEAYREVDPKIDISFKQAMFRINRDVRFSKDKTPYKTHVGAVVCANGKKNMTDPCLYVEIGAKELRLYSGLYMIEKERLYKLREYIAGNLNKFNKLINDKKFRGVFGKVLGDKNKRIPKEFQIAADKQPLLYNKSFYYFKKYNPDVILQSGLIEKLMNDYTVACDLNAFLRKGIGR